MCLAFCNTTSPLLAVGEIEIDTKGHFYLCQTQDVSEAFMEQLHLRSPWVGSTPYIRLEDRKSRSYKREALPQASWKADYTPPNPAFSQHPPAPPGAGPCGSQTFLMEGPRVGFLLSVFI